jgi:hypothetical protein
MTSLPVVMAGAPVMAQASTIGNCDAEHAWPAAAPNDANAVFGFTRMVVGLLHGVRVLSRGFVGLNHEKFDLQGPAP